MDARERQLRSARALATFSAIVAGWCLAATVTMAGYGHRWWASFDWLLFVANGRVCWRNTRIIKRLGGL